MNYKPELLLVIAVAAVGVLHTIVPDHWVPIALLARQHGWSKRETARASLQAGLGHVISTLLIAVAVWLGGLAFASRFGHIVDTVTSLALVGFGAWIAIGALREMQVFGSSRGHHHSRGHAAHHGVDDDPVHGEEQQQFATDEGELKLSIFETGTSAHFRVSGVPIDIARVETRRSDGTSQLFKFKSHGAYSESIEEVPEPHQFAATVMIDHRGHVHSFEGEFVEHDGDGRGDIGPDEDNLYEPVNDRAKVACSHIHLHRHGSAPPHVHWHDHDAGTLHAVLEELGAQPPLHEHRHKTPARTALLLILGSSPMVEGIPAFFAAAKYGFSLLVVMAVVFGLSTITTYVLLCVFSTEGLQRVRLGSIERYGEVFSGAFIALVGILFWIFPIL